MTPRERADAINRAEWEAERAEHGSSQSEAQPFFFPGLRLNRDSVRRNPEAAFKRAVRKAWKAGG